MRYYGIDKKSSPVSFLEAVRTNVAQDGSLFMPETIPVLSKGFFQSLPSMSIHELSFEAMLPFVNDSISKNLLAEIIEKAFLFDAPLKTLETGLYVLELFHGPTAAFKDFGVRFLALVLGHLQQYESKEITVLTATSGDTGGAVADAFFNQPGIKVYILYPHGKVSALQEQQIATRGGNIHAIEVDGTFDDCQRLVNWAFKDPELLSVKRFSSANSINVARLLPQISFYFRGYAQLPPKADTPLFSVPSGNFGNCTSGLIAQKMGMPTAGFIAATNSNDTVPRFLQTGKYEPHPCVETMSNAMDITNPNNFIRICSLVNDNVEVLKSLISAQSFSEISTIDAIKSIYDRYQYIAEPHTAIAYLGAKTSSRKPQMILSTAHPIKFAPTVEKILNQKVPHPPWLQVREGSSKKSALIEPQEALLKQILLS